MPFSLNVSSIVLTIPAYRMRPRSKVICFRPSSLARWQSNFAAAAAASQSFLDFPSSTLIKSFSLVEADKKMCPDLLFTTASETNLFVMLSLSKFFSAMSLEKRGMLPSRGRRPPRPRLSRVSEHLESCTFSSLTISRVVLWGLASLPPSMAEDVSADKDKSMMRTVLNKGQFSQGEVARDLSQVVAHLTVYAPAQEKNQPECIIFDSKLKHPNGITFILGFSKHAEALERSVLNLATGSVADLVCIDEDAATDDLLRIRPTPLGPEAVALVSELQAKEFAQKIESSIIREKAQEYERQAQAWQPPKTMTRWHVRLDSATPGVVPAHIVDPRERIDWSTQQKRWAGELYKEHWFARARRRYKKALLDLEIPTQWDEVTNIERNKLRLALHLNIAQCALKNGRFDEAIFHCDGALKTDGKNVKALYRRACAHLSKPEHVNGLSCALFDLERAHELDGGNREVLTKLSEVRSVQKGLDVRQAASCYCKMFQS